MDGAELLHRPDDSEAVISARLASYEKQTQPLVEYYQARGLLTAVDGAADVDVVTGQIMQIVARAEIQK